MENPLSVRTKQYTWKTLWTVTCYYWDWGSFIFTSSSRRGESKEFLQENSFAKEEVEEKKKTTGRRWRRKKNRDKQIQRWWKWRCPGSNSLEVQTRLVVPLSLQKSEIENEASGSSHSCMHGYTFFNPHSLPLGCDWSRIQCAAHSPITTHMESTEEKWYFAEAWLYSKQQHNNHHQ